MFEHVNAYPGDPILSLNEAFQRDPRPHKVNLSIGIYFDEEGRLPLMRAVAHAESQASSTTSARPYLPMSGMAAYRRAVQELVFGADSALLSEGRVATIQSLGGSGALKVGADFLKRYFPESQIWISDPSWENHRFVFEAAGHRVNTYPYYDPETGGLRFLEMKRALQSLPAKSIVLLHACCHNPTGVDLSRVQWQEIADVMRDRSLIAFVDMAYQGFGDGLDDDALAVRTLAEGGIPCLVANSFSKNFSLYGERCGGLSVVCASPDEADRVTGQLMACVRGNYSNPPTHGAAVIARVLATPELRASWQQELSQMRDRIKAMRSAVHDGLSGRVGTGTLDRYVTQRGMFTYTGLTEKQVDRLLQDHAIYLVRSGRMCIAGLNRGNVGLVCEALGAVMTR
ncbi:MAG TPA: amino acid aminotransferase [Trinickia sp.]